MSVDLRSTRVDKSQLREFTRNRPHNKIWTALYASLRRSLRISSLRLHLCIYARLLRPRLYPRLLPPSPPPCTRLSDVSTYLAQLRPSVSPWPLPCVPRCRDVFYNPALSLRVHPLYRPLRKRLQRTLLQTLPP